jgi:hypothetical protein
MNKLIFTSDYDFPKAAKHKLVLFVYLLINPFDINDLLRSGKVQIFIRLEYLSMSCKVHIVDLMSIIKKRKFS